MSAPATSRRPTAAPVHRVLDRAAIDRACWRLARELRERHPDPGRLVLCGIQRRGVPLARRLAELVRTQGGSPPAVAALDIGPFRDDRAIARGTTAGRGASEAGAAPAAQPLGRATVEGRVVVLVDDVLFHGRTVRAALQAVHAVGRPEAVELCVLVDRGHRQLPVRATYVGRNLPTRETEHVAVRLREVDGEDGVDLAPRWPSR